MKRYITDALQVVAAIVLTGGTLAFAAPLPEKAVLEPSEVVETAKAIETQVEPKKAPEQPKTKPEQVKKLVDPNNCEPKQFWAKEPPHECIDKPVSKPAPTVSAARPVARSVSSGGSCEGWIAAAGINDLVNARELIRRESGCNPNAVNPSSGACGVAQELPCGKSGCSMGDGACQVRWMNSYVIARYGSWAAAVGFHNANNWY